jgi:hypothetical protein
LSGPYKDGGTLFNDQSNPSLANCILWNNYPNQITQINGGATTISFSDVKDGWIGQGNIDADPMFLDEFRGDLRLMSGSPCIDAGSNVALPPGTTTDLGGNIRRADDLCMSDIGLGTAPVVDMGAFELVTPPQCGNGTCDEGETCESCACDCGGCCGDGICEEHEDCVLCAADCQCRNLYIPDNFEHVQEAIQDARNGDHVVIRPGSYMEAIDFLGKSITVTSLVGPYETTIDATGLNTSAVMFRSMEGSDSRLEGLTVTGGKAPKGGGMYADFYSGPTVINCRFVGNSATDGAGIYNYGSTPTIQGSEFIDNNASSIGGGILNDAYSHATVTNCEFLENIAGAGSGIYNYDSTLALRNCTFSGNVALGGVGGGGMFNFRSSATLSDSIFWGNYPSQIINNTSYNVVVSYSDVQGSWPGTGNIAVDPHFVPGPNGCLYLSQMAAGQAADSQCVDAGSDSARELELNTSTTRSDEGSDAGRGDLGFHYPITGQTLVMGDYNRNSRVELGDFREWSTCSMGPGSTRVSPCCLIFDWDTDGHVDLADFAKFESALFGSQLVPSCNPKDPWCDRSK